MTKMTKKIMNNSSKTITNFTNISGSLSLVFWIICKRENCFWRHVISSKRKEILLNDVWTDDVAYLQFTVTGCLRMSGFGWKLSCWEHRGEWLQARHQQPHNNNIVNSEHRPQHAPLIGQYWSRDLYTGLWLVNTVTHRPQTACTHICSHHSSPEIWHM